MGVNNPTCNWGAHIGRVCWLIDGFQFLAETEEWDDKDPVGGKTAPAFWGFLKK